VEIISELDLAAAALDDTRFVVVTGTNGKTTTTSLIGLVLEKAGIHSVVAGNIGSPLIDAALEDVQPDWAIVEASSFQLHDCSLLSPDIGVLTNLAPDHLDRYANVSEYFSDKKRLFLNATEDSIWVTPEGDKAVADLRGVVPGTSVQWSLSNNSEAAFFDRERGSLILGGEVLMARKDLELLGDHNVANALAAALVCSRIGISRETIAEALKGISPLRNRLEIIKTDDARWINDSKATNVSSTAVAIAAMEDSYVLLMGGRHKGESYARLGDLLEAGDCAGVIAFGEAAELIEADLGSFVTVTRTDGLADAVVCASAIGTSTVLFSPACSSFDEFRDYEHRGEEFRRMVAAL
jgi:UDP-N-acetylmuramoylalanine--D-glutamate ligase